jgi:hypothetical protein
LFYIGLQNLPSEIDQNMSELRRMDDDLQSNLEDSLVISMTKKLISSG